jgi:hypothetical protein
LDFFGAIARQAKDFFACFIYGTLGR